MPILLPEDLALKLPRMSRVRQIFSDERLADISGAVCEQMARPEIRAVITPGAKVAVAVGSRGISNLSLIVRTVIGQLKEAGAEPFIVPAMGSHGRGTAEGQRDILASYGLDQETMGVPVISSVEVARLGALKNGCPVYFDQSALAADLVLPINRIKLHTDFVHDIQSGLCKMLVIGLGNHQGCSAMHENGFEHFGDLLIEAAEIIRRKVKVGFGLGIVENAYDQTLMVEAIRGEELVVREKELVKLARSRMPGLMIPEIDVLVVEQIGKNISGNGYDPNILGRSFLLKEFVLPVPKIGRMVLTGLSAQTHGNASGIGSFDVITKEVFEQLDLEDTYANCLAVNSLDDAKIPLIAATEDEAVRVAVKSLPRADKDKLRIVKIKNTLELESIEVSDALLEHVASHPGLALMAD